MKTAARTILAALAIVLAAAGCGSLGSSQPVTYAPAAYGASGQCYYVTSPAEVVALERAGLCPPDWGAAPMPASWLEEYYAFYDSPAYYDTYVPVKIRTVYVARERSFGRSHSTAIRTLASKARYRSSTGRTVTGTTVRAAKARFGSGTSFTSNSSRRSGSLRSRTSGPGSSSRTRSSTRSGSRSGSLRSGRH